ncbi:MAG: class I SAM-dependent methyltransferase [Rhodobiaceae bacterium]|nr:class I SAM-dependent methyltransferase [Rhodobiaceae bacterium]
MAKRTTSRAKGKSEPVAETPATPPAADTGGLRDDDRARLKALVAARRKKARAAQKARAAEEAATPSGQEQSVRPARAEPAKAPGSDRKAKAAAQPPAPAKPAPSPSHAKTAAGGDTKRNQHRLLALHRLLLDRLGKNPERVSTASRGTPSGDGDGDGAADLPSPRKLVNWALDLLPDDAKGYTFVDVGCGRGRAVFEASRHPFDRIIGVEQDTTLYEDAMLNLRHWPRSIMACRDVEFINADPANWPLPPADLVVYIFSPLERKAVLNLTRHLNKQAEDGNRIIVVYINPRRDLALRESPYFHLVEQAGPAARKIRWFSPYAIEIFSTVAKKRAPQRRLPSLRRRRENRS